MPETLAAVVPALTSAGSFLGPVGTIFSAVNGANSLMGGKPKAAAAPVAAQAPPFNPTRPDALARPGNLGEYANFTPEQERSALATKGINQGLGKPEDVYYRNLVERSLIGDNNKLAPDTNSLLPVESQYFSQQGMSPGSNGIMDFLKQLMGAQSTA